MSRPIADQELRDIRRLLSMTVGSETSISVRTVDKITEELLALRAEVERLRPVAALVTIIQKDTGAILADNERLRAVEQAARKLVEGAYYDIRLLRHSYLWDALVAALSANKREPGT